MKREGNDKLAHKAGKKKNTSKNRKKQTYTIKIFKIYC